MIAHILNHLHAVISKLLPKLSYHEDINLPTNVDSVFTILVAIILPDIRATFQ